MVIPKRDGMQYHPMLHGPSKGISSKKRSEVVKGAKKGKDLGKPGKMFNKVANKAAKEYGSKEAGMNVAAAAMWKNMKKG